MNLTKLNASAATLTKNRTEDSVVPTSGMCVTCVDGCIGMCEIGKSAYRGPEAIYPQPFGITTSAGEKSYPVDLSHFTILGTCVGASGIEADSDKAIFPNVNIERKLGHDKGIKVKLPFIIPGLGSTAVAKNNWEGLAIGSAISGIPLTIGENVCGMDPKAIIKNGRIVDTEDMAMRVSLYKEWQQDGYGAIIGQENVEDSRLGVLEYAIEKGIDGIILSKADVDEKGGAAVSVSYVTKKPIIYIGVGQEYNDLKAFEPGVVIEGMGI